jgi:hypothetical protein
MNHMRIFIKAILLVAMLLGMASISDAQVSIGIVIGAPPPPRIVVVPAQPQPECAWVEGYWYPVGKHYKWHDGYWTRPPYEGARWVAPHYNGERYYMGYWEGDRGRIEHDHRWDHDRDRDHHDHGQHGDHDRGQHGDHDHGRDER